MIAAEHKLHAAPAEVATPAGESEAAEILRECSRFKTAVVPCGSGLHQHIRLAPQPPFVALKSERLTQVEYYDPGDLTIGVGAGMTLRELDALVKPHGQWLPVLAFPDRASGGNATIGGLLATAMHGPLKHAFGGVREFCIGVRFVTGDGMRAKGGGRVVKNVAGYDLMKLLIGSYGTLGVITSASFKLFPRPRQTATFVCRFPGLQNAMAVRDALMASPLAPLALEIISPGAAALLHGHADDAGWRVLLRASGSDQQLARYRGHLGNAASAELTGEDEAAAWSLLENFESALPPDAVVVAVSCPLSDVAQVLRSAERAALERKISWAGIGRACTGSLLIAFLGGSRPEQSISAVHALRASAPPSANAVIRRCPDSLKAGIALWQLREGELEIMRTFKNALDPAWILNRGRYFV